MSRANPLRIADYLQHVLDAIDNIQAYTAGMDATHSRPTARPATR